MRILIVVLIMLGDILLQSRRALHPLHMLEGGLLLLMNIVLHLHLRIIVELLSLMLLWHY